MEFSLTFPGVDVVTNEVKCIGKGAHQYTIDISCAFRHVNIDPKDYDLDYFGKITLLTCVCHLAVIMEVRSASI